MNGPQGLQVRQIDQHKHEFTCSPNETWMTPHSVLCDKETPFGGYSFYIAPLLQQQCYLGLFISSCNTRLPARPALHVRLSLLFRPAGTPHPLAGCMPLLK